MQPDKTLQWILIGGIFAIIGMISYSSITLSQEIGMTLDSLNDLNATVRALDGKIRKPVNATPVMAHKLVSQNPTK